MLPSKVRPPRFVSFSQELEPYSFRKAYSLEILNDINLNVLESEAIQKLYTLSKHVLIFTGKRLICVNEARNRKSNQSEYNHWNMFFRDIIRVDIEVTDVQKDVQLDSQQTMELIDALHSMGQKDDTAISLKMKIFFHSGSMNYVEKEERGKTIGRGSTSSHFGDINRIGGGLALSAFGDLRVSSKEVECRVKEFGLLQKVYKQIQKRTDNGNQV
jgi:hypothetical protein